MQMIKEVLEFITGLKDQRPIIQEVDGSTYAVKADRTLGEVIRKPAPIAKPTLVLATLTGFVDAIVQKIDELPNAAVAAHVESFDTVALVSMDADEFGRRHVWLRSKCTEANQFRFGQYYEPEEFQIAVQSSFLPTENAKALLQLSSSLTAGSTVHVADDGFSQSVTVTEGGVSRASVQIPPRIGLAPYRTFREIEAVESDFLVRMQGKKDQLPQIALFAVDGGRWKHDTVLRVKGWLQEKAPDVPVIA
jgi:hypothetical protein